MIHAHTARVDPYAQLFMGTLKCPVRSDEQEPEPFWVCVPIAAECGILDQSMQGEQVDDLYACPISILANLLQGSQLKTNLCVRELVSCVTKAISRSSERRWSTESLPRSRVFRLTIVSEGGNK